MYVNASISDDKILHPAYIRDFECIFVVLSINVKREILLRNKYFTFPIKYLNIFY